MTSPASTATRASPPPPSAFARAARRCPAREAPFSSLARWRRPEAPSSPPSTARATPRTSTTPDSARATSSSPPREAAPSSPPSRPPPDGPPPARLLPRARAPRHPRPRPNDVQKDVQNARGVHPQSGRLLHAPALRVSPGRPRRCRGGRRDARRPSPRVRARQTPRRGRTPPRRRSLLGNARDGDGVRPRVSRAGKDGRRRVDGAARVGPLRGGGTRAAGSRLARGRRRRCASRRRSRRGGRGASRRARRREDDASRGGRSLGGRRVGHGRVGIGAGVARTRGGREGRRDDARASSAADRDDVRGRRRDVAPRSRVSTREGGPRPRAAPERRPSSVGESSGSGSA